jgi:hypothetical protein
MRETLIFGQNYAGGIPLDPAAAVAALPDDAEICGCNGVCKGKITGAIAGPRAEEPRRGAGAYQGLGVVRLLHRPGRAAPERPSSAMPTIPPPSSRCAAAPISATTTCAA